MGLFDKITGKSDQLKEKAADVVDEHADKIDQGIEKTGDFINDKTGGKFEDKIEAGGDKLREGLDSLDGKKDDFPDRQSKPTTPPA